MPSSGKHYGAGASNQYASAGYQYGGAGSSSSANANPYKPVKRTPTDSSYVCEEVYSIDLYS